MQYIPSYPQPNNGYGYQYNAGYNGTPFGAYGYNNYYGQNPYQQGYYNYNPYYYDPLAARKAWEEQQRRQEEFMRAQLLANKRVAECNMHFFGIDYDQKELDEEYTLEHYYEEMNDYQQRAQMYKLHREHQRQVEMQRQREEEMKNYQYPTEVPNLSLYEFLEQAEDEYIQMKTAQMQSQQRRAVGQLYNHSSYKDLLQIHNANKFLNPDTSIEDLSITLPEHLRKNRDARLQAFLNSIKTNDLPKPGLGGGNYG